MQVELIAYGIARDILGARQMQYHVQEGDTIVDLKRTLETTYPSFNKLVNLAFAIGEEYVPDERELQEGDVIIILPPVSGG